MCAERRNLSIVEASLAIPAPFAFLDVGAGVLVVLLAGLEVGDSAKVSKDYFKPLRHGLQEILEGIRM